MSAVWNPFLNENAPKLQKGSELRLLSPSLLLYLSCLFLSPSFLPFLSLSLYIYIYIYAVGSLSWPHCKACRVNNLATFVSLPFLFFKNILLSAGWDFWTKEHKGFKKWMKTVGSITWPHVPQKCRQKCGQVIDSTVARLLTLLFLTKRTHIFIGILELKRQKT